jgi:tyrosyl-tRNA synthetase
MQALQKKEKYVLTTKLLTDSQGVKIGKTTGNAINLFGDPNDLYGAIMSQPDSVIIPGFELATTIPLSEIELLKSQAATNPMDTKKRLAYEVVKLCHSEIVAETAQAHFESVFQEKSTNNSTIPTQTINMSPCTLIELLDRLKLGGSNSDRKRLIRDGAVSINQSKLTDPTAVITPKPEDVIKCGKHTFVKISIKK